MGSGVGGVVACWGWRYSRLETPGIPLGDEIGIFHFYSRCYQWHEAIAVGIANGDGLVKIKDRLGHLRFPERKSMSIYIRKTPNIINPSLMSCRITTPTMVQIGAATLNNFCTPP